MVLYSISPGLAAIKGVDENYYVTKQLIAIGLGTATFFIASAVPTSLWKRLRKPLIITCVIAVVVALLTPLSTETTAHRWVLVGGLSFQVAELIKFTAMIWGAYFLAERWRNMQLKDSKATLQPLALAIVGTGLVVAVLQSDLGSAAVITAMLGMMAFVVGVPMKKIMLILGIIAVGVIIAISASDYRRERLFTFMHPERDCQSSGYQACQALIAVGSGGLTGLGLGNSVQAFGYLPEASNDSIFAIMAEKFGFIGVTVIIGLYVLLIARLKRIIEHTADQFHRLIVIGVLAWVSTQAIINIGAMIGLLPLKGITLPLVSYGGTSLLFVTAALGVVFRISRYTNYSIVEPQLHDEAEKSTYDSRGGRRLGRAYNPRLVSRPRA